MLKWIVSVAAAATLYVAPGTQAMPVAPVVAGAGATFKIYCSRYNSYNCRWNFNYRGGYYYHRCPWGYTRLANGVCIPR
jgi:hypothetical protein